MSAYEIDRAKDKQNRLKHGIALPFGNYVFDGLYYETVDRRRDYAKRD